MGPTPPRGLVLAGGGMKVAFQAGVLQVWLDEAGLQFDHVDAASGGVFNAALMCHGLTGTEIADRWRSFVPSRGAALNWRHPLHSIFTLDRFRANVLRGDWALDWPRIRATGLDVSFNVFDVATQRNRVVPAAAMTEDLLVAAVSLPMWFPPVIVEGEPHIDAVFFTDANLANVVTRGARDLWVVWTVSRAGRWRAGFLNHYFQVIEAAANGRFQDECDRLRADGVTIEVLEAEVALNYLVNFNRDRFAEAVEQGVRAGRQWCDDRGIPYTSRRAGVLRTPLSERVSLTFREPFGGKLVWGARMPDEAAPRPREGFAFDVTAHMAVDDVDRFLADPDHELVCDGVIKCAALGGRLPVPPRSGGVRLNTDVPGSPGEKRMTYRLPFRDASGHPLTFTCLKVVRNDPGFDLWDDTTRFHTRILTGHVDWDQLDDPAVQVVAAGTLRITLLQFTRSLLTYRHRGPSRRKALVAHVRFIRAFLGKLWDVYASKLSTFSPF
jgi:predicted acylesterase/phospholipase RssA